MFTKQFRVIVTAVLLVSMTTLTMPMGLVYGATDLIFQNPTKTISATGNQEFKAVSMMRVTPDPAKNKQEGAALTQEQQKALTPIFGTTPVTIKVTTGQPGICGAGVRTDYYDKDGNLIGSMSQNPTTGHTKQTYYDKNGKAIDIAEKLNQNTVTAQQAANVINSLDKETRTAIFASSKLSVEKAAAIIAAMNPMQAVGMLEAMDPQKAARILSARDMRVCGGPSINPIISSGKSAEILAGMETNKAAAILNNMGDGSAALVVNALNEDTAAKILGAMDSKQIAAILAAQNSNGAVAPQYHTVWDVITTEKATSLLRKLDLAKTDSILTELDKTNQVKADQIRTKIDTSWLNNLGSLPIADAAAYIAGYVKDAATAKAVADALAKIDPFNAARIIGNSSLTKKTAAQIFSQMTAAQAAKIIGGPFNVQIALMPGGGTYTMPISAVKAAGILAAMDPAKAAGVLAELNFAYAGVLIGSDSMSVNTAKDIFSCMATDKVVKILETCNCGKNVSGVYYLGAAPGSPLSAQKAADILTAMINPSSYSIAALNCILSQINANIAATIISKMDPGKASRLFWQQVHIPYMDTISVSTQTGITQLLSAEKAAAILNSNNMSVNAASKILKNNDANTQKIVLAALDKTNRIKADQIRAQLNLIKFPKSPFIPVNPITPWPHFKADNRQLFGGLEYTNNNHLHLTVSLERK